MEQAVPAVGQLWAPSACSAVVSGMIQEGSRAALLYISCR